MRLLTCTLIFCVSFACDASRSGPPDDTIEAWEAWLEAHPSDHDQFRGEARLQDLLLERARRLHEPEAYDRYLQRFPQGAHVDTVQDERQRMMFRTALREGSVNAWERFIEDYPKARGGHDKIATDGLAAARYAPHMKRTPVRTKEVNLADDPDGPLNGTAFSTDITNHGDRAVQSWWLRIFYLDAEGEVLDRRKWPLVATPREFPVPMPPEASEPLQPGETRTWTWSTGDLPDGFSGDLALVPMRVGFANAGESR